MCDSLSVDFSPDCQTALKKLGGFANFGYIFTVDDISAVAVTAGEITGFTFRTAKQAIKFTTKDRTITAPSPADAEGESNIALVNHTVNFPIYFSTQAELTEAYNVLNADKVAVVLPTPNKQFRVYGISTNSALDFSGFGMMNSGSTDNSGQNLNDPSRLDMALSGLIPNLPAFMDVGTGYADTLTELESYLTPAS